MPQHSDCFCTSLTAFSIMLFSWLVTKHTRWIRGPHSLKRLNKNISGCPKGLHELRMLFIEVNEEFSLLHGILPFYEPLIVPLILEPLYYSHLCCPHLSSKYLKLMMYYNCNWKINIKKITSKLTLAFYTFSISSQRHLLLSRVHKYKE